MRIAIFVHCFFPEHVYGTETYTLELARNLLSLGHEVTVVSAVFAGEPSRSAVITSYDYQGVPVIVLDKNHVPHTRVSETYYQPAIRPFLRQVIKDIAPDIIHVTHLINHTAVLIEEASAAGVPVVATLTDFFGFCFNNKLEAADGSLCAGPNRLRTNCLACYMKAARLISPELSATLDRVPYAWQAAGLTTRIANRMGRQLVPNAAALVHDLAKRPDVLRDAYLQYDAMIAPSQFLRNAYSSNGFPPERLHLSRFGVDIDRSPKSKRATGAPIVIGYVGQLAAHKGVDLLVAAVSQLPQEEIRLVIYGSETQDPEYTRKLKDISTANVEFRGTFPPERIAAVMREFDLLAIPSTWYENSPLVLLYALASHTPVVVSDVEGLTEFIEEGVNGWSFKRADMQDLHRLLKRLISHPDAIRQASAQTTYERTTMAMTQEAENIYRSVLARARPRDLVRPQSSATRAGSDRLLDGAAGQ